MGPSPSISSKPLRFDTVPSKPRKGKLSEQEKADRKKQRQRVAFGEKVSNSECPDDPCSTLRLIPGMEAGTKGNGSRFCLPDRDMYHLAYQYPDATMARLKP